MKLTLAACAAALALAACGGGSSGSGGGGTSSGGTTTGGTTGGTTSKADCKKQGVTWKNDNKDTLKSFENAIKGFTDGVPTAATAKKLQDVAHDAASHPLPACADPKGLWSKAMSEVADAAKAAGKGGIEAEAAALPKLEKALKDLTALQNEVKNKVNLGQI